VAESEEHKGIVRQLCHWIIKKYETPLKMEVDLNRTLLPDIPVLLKRPMEINGYRPDVIAHYKNPDLMIIGEAETGKSIGWEETEHQLETFIRYCEEYPFTVLIIAVPFEHTRHARNIVRWIVLDCDIKRANVIVPQDFYWC
jgi:hypothetical protein